jgi:hypothetical protein
MVAAHVLLERVGIGEGHVAQAAMPGVDANGDGLPGHPSGVEK